MGSASKVRECFAIQRCPEYAAVIFGRPIIGSLVRWIIEAQDEEGVRLLSQFGREAGRLAASAPPPLLEQLGMTISDALLARRMRDLQVMGWANFERASLDGASRGKLAPVDTFEAAAWNGEATSPCHFAGSSRFEWERSIECRELECQATGAERCRFRFRLFVLRRGSQASDHEPPASPASRRSENAGAAFRGRPGTHFSGCRRAGARPGGCVGASRAGAAGIVRVTGFSAVTLTLSP